MARLASFIGLVTVLIINLSLSHGVPARDASYDYQSDADSYNYNDDEEYYNYDTGSNGSNEDIYDASGKKEVVNKRDPTFMVQPKKTSSSPPTQTEWLRTQWMPRKQS